MFDTGMARDLRVMNAIISAARKLTKLGRLQESVMQ